MVLRFGLGLALSTGAESVLVASLNETVQGLVNVLPTLLGQLTDHLTGSLGNLGQECHGLNAGEAGGTATATLGSFNDGRDVLGGVLDGFHVLVGCALGRLFVRLTPRSYLGFR